MTTQLYRLAKRVGVALKKEKLLLASAESCTGGLLATTLTDVAGSSAYFERGFVAYSNHAKIEALGVKQQTLKKHGAVSEATAKAMAQGALRRSHAHVSIAITGIAGPTGGTKLKPKGTVCFALASKKMPPQTLTKHFKGNRNMVKTQAVIWALQWLLSFQLNT